MKKATELLINTYLTGRVNSNDQNSNDQNKQAPSHKLQATVYKRIEA